MQMDVKSVYAERVLPALRGIVPPPGVARQAAALLADWDGTMARDRPEPLIFNAWLRRFLDLVLARAGLVQSAAIPTLEFTASVLAPGGAGWCGGDCRAMLQDALESATADLAARYGTDPAAWRWGAAHQAVFANPLLAAIPLLGPLTTARIDGDGDESTVDRGGMRPDSFDDVHGASFRGAYDLADLDASQFVMAPGQSGNPVSSHARDFIERWRKRWYYHPGTDTGARHRHHHLDRRAGPMSSTASMAQDDLLTAGVISRRILAWFVDALLITLIASVVWMVFLLFGLLTLGLGLGLLALVPVVPALYHILFLAGPASATPGQRMMGLVVRRESDLGRPTPLQAVLSTVGLALTLATGVIWLAVALITPHRRTLHDMLAGVVVVNARALASGFYAA